MPTVPLPDNPSLEYLRKQAKDVRDLARAGVPGALDLYAEHHPAGRERITLAGAQLVTARHYGFTSRARLKHHVEVIQRSSRARRMTSGRTSLVCTCATRAPGQRSRRCWWLSMPMARSSER